VITAIDHRAREKLSLSLTEYAVIDYVHQHKQCKLNYRETGKMLGISPGQVSKSVHSGILNGLLETVDKNDNREIFRTTSIWVDTVIRNSEEKTEKIPYREVAREGIIYLNERLGKHQNGYQWKTYEKEFKALSGKLIKQYPHLTVKRIILNVKAVIDHKILQWSDNPEMSQYLRPSTLFSGKFLKYLDEARTYFKNQRL